MQAAGDETVRGIDEIEALLHEGFIVLTPNLRLARSLSAAWNRHQQQAGRQAWARPGLQPLDGWLRLQWQRAVRGDLLQPGVVLDELQAQELWRRVIARDQQESGEYTLLQPAASARMAQQARENLLRWQVDTSAPAVRDLFRLDPDCAAFLRWLEAFERALAKQQWLTSTDAVAQLAGCASDLPQHALALLDFDDLPPLYRTCVEQGSSELRLLQSATAEARCELRDYPDRRAELMAAARWARAESLARPEARLGIVLQDMDADRGVLEYFLRTEFDCLGAAYDSLPVNFSTGITLDQAPVVRDALRLLALCGEQVTTASVVALQQSRFFQAPDRGSAQAARFLQRLGKVGREYLRVADLRHLANQPLSAADDSRPSFGARLLQLASLRELRQSAPPSAWVERICQVLDVWQWPGPGPLDSLEYQQVEAWYATLEQFAACDAVCGQLSLSQALALLRRCLESRVSQPQTADSAVQVLGPLEAAGLEFHALWLCGMQASQWPAAARPHPLIPLSLQRQREMPHATPEREWHIANRLLRQYRSHCHTLVASHAREVDGVPEQPSALLAAFERAADPAGANYPVAWRAAREAVPVTAWEDNDGPPLAAPEAAAMGGGAGLLEEQARCPFQAFARRRLGASAPEPLDTGPSPAERGTVLHAALRALFEHIPDSRRLATLDAATESGLVAAAADAGLRELPQAGPRAPTAAWRALERQRLQDLLRQWLEVERERGDFVVQGLEQSVTLALAPLEFTLRLDRVDRVADGGEFIIDYKSGRSSLGGWLDERLTSPQLPLYSLVATGPPAALALAQVRHDDCRYVGAGREAAAPGVRSDIDKLVRGGWEVESWDALNARWARQLTQLVTEFVAGRAAVEPTAGACTWCELGPLCRVDMTAEDGP